jgi:hypothetical protein
MEEALAALEVAAGREGTAFEVAFEVAFDCGDALRRAGGGGGEGVPGTGPVWRQIQQDAEGAAAAKGGNGAEP